MAASLLYRNKLLFRLDIVNKAGIVKALTFKRSIMSSRANLEKALDGLKTNPFFDKYAQKIAKLQNTDPEEFLERVQEKERKAKEEKERNASKAKQFAATQSSKRQLSPSAPKRESRLSDILKLDLVEGKSSEEIGVIWREYHAKKDCIAGVLSAAQYQKMFERGGKYGTFLLPLPRDNGYEFIVTQFQGAEVHMTPLIWYQTHKENAPECLTMVHYTELMAEKGIALMRGEFDAKSISATEAQCLANELQMYYASDHPQRLELVRKFTERPDEFKHMDLIAHLETLSFDAGASGELMMKKSEKK